MRCRTTAPYRVVLSSGTWESGITTLQGALASWQLAPQPAAIYDANGQRLDPGDGQPGIEVGEWD